MEEKNANAKDVSFFEKNAFHALRFLPSPLFWTFLFISSSGGMEGSTSAWNIGLL